MLSAQVLEVVAIALVAGLAYGLVRYRRKVAKRALIEAAMGSRGKQPYHAPSQAQHGALKAPSARPRGTHIGWYNGRPIWSFVEVTFMRRRYQLPFLRVVHGFRPGSAPRELGVRNGNIRWMRTTAGVLYGVEPKDPH